MNPFDILGVSENSSPEEIREAYFLLVKQHPPDRDPVEFQKIRTAYELANNLEERLRSKFFKETELDVWNPPKTGRQPLKYCRAKPWLDLIKAANES